MKFLSLLIPKKNVISVFITGLSLTFFSIMLAQSVSAQFSYAKYRDDFHPKSPNTEGLLRYIEWPVDKSSGTLNITIPIHTLKVNGFELPISLDYHTGGIKVNQLASSVGLGWVLNTGGILTRTVKGDATDEDGIGPIYGSGGGYLSCRGMIPYTKDRVYEHYNALWVGMPPTFCGQTSFDHHRLNWTWSPTCSIFHAAMSQVLLFMIIIVTFI
jgi:hypothetical protein